MDKSYTVKLIFSRYDVATHGIVNFSLTFSWAAFLLGHPVHPRGDANLESIKWCMMLLQRCYKNNTYQDADDFIVMKDLSLSVTGYHVCTVL